MRRRWTRTGRRNRFEWPRVSSARALPNAINSSSSLFCAPSRPCRLNHHGWREKPAGPGSLLRNRWSDFSAASDSPGYVVTARVSRSRHASRRGPSRQPSGRARRFIFRIRRVYGFRDRFYINARESLSAGPVPNHPIDCSSLAIVSTRLFDHGNLPVNRPAIFAAIAPIPTFVCTCRRAPSDASESVASVHRLLFPVPRGCHRYTRRRLFHFFSRIFVFMYLRWSRYPRPRISISIARVPAFIRRLSFRKCRLHGIVTRFRGPDRSGEARELQIRIAR